MVIFKLIIQELRPKQWLKNVILILPAIFADEFFHFANLKNLLLGFFFFSLAAGGLYIINDIIDRKKDAHHPEKKKRPIASGRLSVAVAAAAAALILIAAAAGSFWLEPRFFIILIVYAAITNFYSFYLKHLPIIDLVTIAAGFILRVVAGAILVNVEISNWIIIATFFFALFLATTKRRLELRLLEIEAKNHRAVLDEYTPTFSNILLGLTAALAITSYSIYTLEESVVARLGTKGLIYTVPLVFIFIARMAYLATEDKNGQTSDPTNLILKDKAIYLSLISWLVAVILIIFYGKF